MPSVSKVGSEFLVNTQTANWQMGSSVASLADSSFVVSWFDTSKTVSDASAESIKAQVFDADGANAGSGFLVNTETANSQILPRMTALTNGGFVVTWSHGVEEASGGGTLGDSSGSSIKALKFSAEFVKVGSEFILNTQTVNF